MLDCESPMCTRSGIAYFSSVALVCSIYQIHESEVQFVSKKFYILIQLSNAKLQSLFSLLSHFVIHS